MAGLSHGPVGRRAEAAPHPDAHDWRARHRDNLCLLGGELIRRRYDDDELARLGARDALRYLIEADEAPLMWPTITESAQNSLDATARKLNRFMRDSTAERTTS